MFAAVDIFFESLAVKVSERMPPPGTNACVQVVERREKMPIEELISNAGGQIGLWLGASVISMVQAAFYMAYYVLHSTIFRYRQPIKVKGRRVL
jgi:hypothetical protein